MLSFLFRSSLRRAVTASALFSALLVSGAAPRTPAEDAAQLSSIVRIALSQAPVNFAAWRAGVRNADTNGVSFKLSASLKQICPVCEVYDEYAAADTNERYALQFDWLVPKSWSRAKTVAYIQHYVGELVPGYTVQQGTDDNGESWFDWTKGSPKEFVYVVTYSGAKANGFRVRVGHYLQKNLHYTLYARLNDTQRADLGKAVRNFVQLGVSNGSDNFASLRGRATAKDKKYFDTSVSFGEFLKTCDVDGIFSDEHASGSGTSKWILECDTPSLGGSKGDIEAIIHSAVVDALPGGFTSTTDPTYLGSSDYRWDRSSDTMAVEVTSNDNNDGTFDYHVEIFHFTT